MKASWDSRDFVFASRATLLLTSIEAEIVRARLHARDVDAGEM